MFTYKRLNTVKIQCLGEHCSSGPRFFLIIVSVLEIISQTKFMTSKFLFMNYHSNLPECSSLAIRQIMFGMGLSLEMVKNDWECMGTLKVEFWWRKIESNNSYVATRNYQQTITIPASPTKHELFRQVEDNWAQQNKTKHSYAQLRTSK